MGILKRRAKRKKREDAFKRLEAEHQGDETVSTLLATRGAARAALRDATLVRNGLALAAADANAALHKALVQYLPDELK